MILFNFTFYSMLCAIFLVFYFKREHAISRAGIIVFSILTIVWLWATLSFREPAGDPWRYMLGLNNISKLNFSELLNYDKSAFGFALLNWLTALVSTSSIFFFSVIYFSCLLPLYLAFRERFNKIDALSLMMLYLLYPFYINYLASGFKQGIAFGFMLWGLNCILDNRHPKWLKGSILLLIATLFHPSFWIVIISIVIWQLLFRHRAVNWAIYALIFSMFLSFIGFSEIVANSILPKSVIDSLGFNEYFDGSFESDAYFNSLNYKSGFRLDFALFTFSPILFIYFLKKKSALIDPESDFVKIYCLLASAYFILNFIAFSDRIAAFSWFLIPFLLYDQLGKTSKSIYRPVFLSIMLGLYIILMITYTKGFFQ